MVTITMHFDEGPSYIAIWLKEGFTVLEFSAMNTQVAIITTWARIPSNNSLELNSWVGGQCVDHSFSEVAKVTGTECL